MGPSSGRGWRDHVKAVLPAVLQEPARQAADFVGNQSIAWQTRRWGRRDIDRYLRWQHSRNRRFTLEQLRSKIIKTYHTLEKGLSLAAPRGGFGKPAALILKSQIEDYIEAFGFDDFLVAPIRVLENYAVFQERSGEQLPIIAGFLRSVEPQLAALGAAKGGTVSVSAQEIVAAGAVPLRPFLEHRHSIRHFADRPVGIELLAEACQLAQLAPSACNRQGGRAHCFNTPELVTRIIGLQPGNRGFGTSAGAVIVVTGDIRSYSEAGERRQALVDASLFAMTLVYALHSQGLGTCMLAWCVAPEIDDAMRQAAGIADAEEIAMLIAVGHLPPTLNVPVSTRYQPDEVATINLAPFPAG